MPRKESKQLRIALVGMEELPALTALRLRQAGYPGADALSGLRGLALLRATAAYDVVHAVFPTYYLKWVPAWKAAGKRVVFHWIGSDLYSLGRRTALRSLFWTVRAGVDLHIADAPWLVDDLKALGLEAHLVPTISEKMAPGPQPLPARLRVLAYVPDRRRDFYGWHTIRMLAELYPGSEFIAVGGAAEEGAPANVRFEGYLDGAGMDRVYRETSVLLRPTANDGLSQMVLEALGRGRQVVWSRRFPHCHYAETAAEYVSAMEQLLAECPPNDAGAAYVAEHYSAAAAAAALARAYGFIKQR
jgi:hypothetical protein